MIADEEYLVELREALKEARRIARQAEVEKEVFQQQSAEFKRKLKEFQGPSPAVDVRMMPETEYQNLKTHSLRTIRQQAVAEKEALVPDLKVDVRNLNKHEYAQFKKKLLRR